MLKHVGLIQWIIFYDLYFILFNRVHLLVNILNILNKFGFDVYDMTPYTMEDISRFREKPAASIFHPEEESSRFLWIVDKFTPDYTASRGPDSAVGTATGYGLDGPGIEPRGSRFSATVQTGPGAHPASCTMGTESFPGTKSDRGVTLTPHPF